MADKVHIAGEAPGPASEPCGGEGAHPFALTAATVRIVGERHRGRIFNLPTSLAGCGPITLLFMALTSMGALALLFATPGPAPTYR
jgi:APA family basic amino acid/polyamine antiporter